MASLYTGSKWGQAGNGTSGGTVTWSFALSAGSLFDFDGVISGSAYQALVRSAFDAWEKVADIDFVEVADAVSANIRLGWDAIDGAGDTLGETIWELSGQRTTHAEVAFDLGETWALSTGAAGFNFFAVALHEIGHAIGLAHAENAASIMYPYLGKQTALTSADIAAIRTLYGTGSTGGVVQPSGNSEGTDAADRLFGSEDGDRIFGGKGDDTIWGRSGADLLDGGSGADTMDGGAGNDTFYVDNAGDRVIEDAGEGSDRVVSSVGYTLGAGQEIEVLETSKPTLKTALNLSGNSFDQSIVGNDGANKIRGEAGNDSLRGNGGSDTLYGGLGMDFLSGGAGNDSFVFDTAPGAGNIDTIGDFANLTGNNDRILLENAVFTALTRVGTLASGLFQANAAGVALQADDRVVYQTGTGKLFYDADGSGKAEAVLFAQLTDHPAITYADFLVI